MNETVVKAIKTFGGILLFLGTDVLMVGIADKATSGQSKGMRYLAGVAAITIGGFITERATSYLNRQIDKCAECLNREDDQYGRSPN